MAFKAHPYYDESGSDDWLPVIGAEPMVGDESGWLAVRVQTLRAEQERLCALALQRIRRHAGEEDLAERPHPELGDLLFIPIDDHGYRVYVEYRFFRDPDKNRPESDFWWVIVNCPYAIGPFSTRKRQYQVTGLGWVVG